MKNQSILAPPLGRGWGGFEDWVGFEIIFLSTSRSASGCLLIYIYDTRASDSH